MHIKICKVESQDKVVSTQKQLHTKMVCFNVLVCAQYLRFTTGHKSTLDVFTVYWQQGFTRSPISFSNQQDVHIKEHDINLCTGCSGQQYLLCTVYNSHQGKHGYIKKGVAQCVPFFPNKP